jgi:hypothetical protein
MKAHRQRCQTLVRRPNTVWPSRYCGSLRKKVELSPVLRGISVMPSGSDVVIGWLLLSAFSRANSRTSPTGSAFFPGRLACALDLVSDCLLTSCLTLLLSVPHSPIQPNGATDDMQRNPSPFLSFAGDHFLRSSSATSSSWAETPQDSSVGPN